MNGILSTTQRFPHTALFIHEHQYKYQNSIKIDRLLKINSLGL